MSPNEVRDVFERALEAKRDLDHLRARLGRLAEGSLPGGIPQAIHSGIAAPTERAGMELADASVELRRSEAALADEVARCERLCDGIGDAMGLVYGDILRDRYVGALAWERVAELNDVSKSTALRYRDVAFEWVASVGIHRAERGEGNAES